jgi:hypothetical protein
MILPDLCHGIEGKSPPHRPIQPSEESAIHPFLSPLWDYIRSKLQQ